MSRLIPPGKWETKQGQETIDDEKAARYIARLRALGGDTETEAEAAAREAAEHARSKRCAEACLELIEKAQKLLRGKP
jgi:hypothetical protein